MVRLCFYVNIICNFCAFNYLSRKFLYGDEKINSRKAVFLILSKSPTVIDKTTLNFFFFQKLNLNVDLLTRCPGILYSLLYENRLFKSIRIFL